MLSFSEIYSPDCNILRYFYCQSYCRFVIKMNINLVMIFKMILITSTIFYTDMIIYKYIYSKLIDNFYLKSLINHRNFYWIFVGKKKKI